jgi:hypothetical protein
VIIKRRNYETIADDCRTGTDRQTCGLRIHDQASARRFVPVTDAKLQKPTNSDWLIMKSRSNPFACPNPFCWPQQKYGGH